MAGIDDFLKTVQGKFNKKFKESETTLESLGDAKEVTGLIVDNPLFEFLLDRRFMAYGRAYLIYGNKGNAKTSTFYDIAKQVIAQNGYVFWFETEHAYDKNYAIKQGVDVNKLIVSNPKTIEEAYTMILLCIQNLDKLDPTGDTPVLVCLDSIAGCMTEYENDTSVGMGDMRVAARATATQRFYSRLVAMLEAEKCIFLALNQKKTKIGQAMPGQDMTSLPGGTSQTFHSTYQWDISKVKEFYDADQYGAERKVGSRHAIVGKRNKLGREGNKQRIEYDLYIDGGIDWWSPLVRKLADEYPFMVSHTRGYSWQLEGYEFVLPDGSKGEIPVGESMKESELGMLIKHSTQAKEKIREVFGIPPLPKVEEVVVAEKARKEKRKTRKKEEIVETDFKEEPVYEENKSI